MSRFKERLALLYRFKGGAEIPIQNFGVENTLLVQELMGEGLLVLTPDDRLRHVPQDARHILDDRFISILPDEGALANEIAVALGCGCYDRFAIAEVRNRLGYLRRRGEVGARATSGRYYMFAPIDSAVKGS